MKQRYWFGGLLAGCLVAGLAVAAAALPVTFSGTVSYSGSYSGDSLYVAVLDTTGVEDVTLLDLQVFAVGAPPFSQPYVLNFDNDGLTNDLIVASFLDVDGGGVDSVSGNDVLGWYNGTIDPAPISPASSQVGLDFDLPLAEVHGTVTFAPGQAEANIWATSDVTCEGDTFRPQVEVSSSGAYSIVGLYPGTYCVMGEGFGPTFFGFACFGGCSSPTPVTLTQTEVRNNVDLDFTDTVPVEAVSWGQVKSKYR